MWHPWLRKLVKALSRFTTGRARPGAPAKKKWSARNLAVELLETRIVPSVSTPTLVGYTQATDSGVLGDRVTNALHQTVEGTATAGNDITVFEIVGTTRTQLGTTTADTNGKWTFDLDRTESAFKLQANASDGTTSKFSTAREFVVDTSAPVVDIPIDDVSTSEDGADSVIDVGGTFIDALIRNDNDTLTLSIASNDNSSLLTASIENGTDLRLHLLANQNGLATITVQAMDAAGNVTTDAFQVAVAAVNDAPAIAAPGGQSVDEDNPLIFSQDNSNAIAVSDVDVAETSGGQLEVSLSVGSGTLTLSGTAGLDFGFAGAQGSGVGDATMTFRGTAADINAALEGLTYAPGPDFNGSDTLAITTNDLGNSGAGGPLSDTKSVAITVNAVNDAPVAKADSNNTDKNTPVSGNVLTNDTDIEGDALVVTSAGTFTTAAGATVTLHPDGSYSYDPTTSSSLNALALGATATDSFNYSISDGNGGTSSATVTIMVSGVNDAPVPSPGPSPGLTAGERYLSRVYINLFGRPVDPEGMAHWGGMLNAGADPLSIVRLLQQSIEYHTREIELAYRRYLHHDADPVGMSLALNYLNSGGTIETILAVIFASPEYYQTQGGGNNTSFSDAIYRDTVGRPLDAASRPLVLSFLTNGGSRFRFAEALLNSLEYEQKMVAELYQTFLHRGLDAKAIDAVLALHRGGRVEEVIAGIVGSPEAFSLAQS